METAAVRLRADCCGDKLHLLVNTRDTLTRMEIGLKVLDYPLRLSFTYLQRPVQSRCAIPTELLPGFTGACHPA